MKRTKSCFKGKVLHDARKQLLRTPTEHRSEKLNEKLRMLEDSFERRLLIGCIVNDDVCKWAVENFHPNLLSAPTAKIITGWCIDYFEKYKKAPRKDIEGIYTQKLKEGLPQDKAEWVEEILEGMSKEYEESDVNPAYLIDQAKHYKDKQFLKRRIQEAEECLNNNDVEDAMLLLGYEPSTGQTNLLAQIEQCMTTSSEFIKKDIPKPKRLIKPWLTEGSITLVFGPKGVGKTWFCTCLAVALTRGKDMDLDFGPWQVKHKAGVMYVDAEMGAWDFQENLAALAKPLPPEDAKNPLIILSGHDFVQQHEKQITITSEEWRNTLYKAVQQNRRIRVLILDNIAALSPGLDENKKQDWDPINQWLISLRHLGVAVLLVHHAGKGGLQRGTSGREDAVDNIIKLSLPQGYTYQDGAWFKLAFEKARNLRPGEGKKPFTIRIVEHPDGGLTWQEEEGADRAGDKEKRIMAAIIIGQKNKEIAKTFDCSSSYVSQIKQKAVKEGHLDKRGGVTETGRALAQEYKEDEAIE